MSERKRVVINLLNFTDSQIAGAGVFARNLLRAWFKASSLDDIVIYHSDLINVSEVFGLTEFKWIKFKTNSSRSLWSRIFYEQLLLPFSIRGSHVYFSPTPVMPFLSRVVNPKMRHIITIHDMIPFFVANKYGRFRSAYVKFISKYGARMSSNVITVSENSKQDICDITSVRPEKVSVVYNFIPSDLISMGSSYERFFISISTIEPGKNIENTLRGFRNFLNSSSYPDFKFYWIGKVGWGYKLENLMQEIGRLNLQDSFFLLGYVSNERKNELLKACTAMIYLSHYEGFGLPVLEALHFNKPSVVSNTSSLPEVVGRAGIICDKEDAYSIEAAMTSVVTNLHDYIREIPYQLHKFTEESQIIKFLNVIDLKIE
ncbi:MAG: glycosyltransferase family 1 protein [Dyadobacter sp.]